MRDEMHRALRVAATVSVLLASGCSGDDSSTTIAPPANASEFLATYARLVCEKTLLCDTAYAAYTQAECETMVLADFQGGTLDARLQSGALAFDAGRAQACLELLAASPACAASDDYCFEDGAFVGTLGPGAACDSSHTWLCGPGTVCSVDPWANACGSCTAITLADLGEPCNETAECLQTAARLAYCDYDTVDMRDECFAWTNPTVVPVGARCDLGDVVCAVGAECDWSGDGLCHAQIALEAECDPDGDIGCIGGAPCLDDALSSLSGRCRAFAVARNVGDACGLVGTTFFECDRSTSLYCEASTNTCVASAPAGVGADCSNDGCAAGLYCDTSTAARTCAPLLGLGVACSENHQCSSGLCIGVDPTKVCGDASDISAACAP